MSVRRIDSLRSAFPVPVGRRIDSFARLAREAGDTRWKPTGVTAEGDLPVRSGKGPARLDLGGPPTLLLKLRAGSG